MTAKYTGKYSASALWLALKRLREHWVLIAFVATALYSARDIYDEVALMPGRVEAMHLAMTDLEQGVARLEDAVTDPVIDRSEALSFPGMRHAASDGQPGSWIMARFRPVHELRPECQPAGLMAYMIDADRRWFSVQTDLEGWPRMDSLDELAFGVEVHPRMAVGRAQLLLQVIHDCSGRLQVDSSPALQFRVLGPEIP